MDEIFSTSWINTVLGTSENLEAEGFSSISTDSRSIEPGALFIPIKGDRFDGHDFIEKAMKSGATGFLYQADSANSVPEDLLSKGIEVDECLAAFRRMMAAWRQRFELPIFAIAGSNGKTTTKEMLASALSGKFSNVLKTRGSENGYLGIAITLSRLRPEHDAAVIEIGIDAVGAMDEHIHLVDPSYSVVTSIGHEHLEFLKDLGTVALEEGQALRYVNQTDGFCALNLDDPWLQPLTKEIKERCVRFSVATETAGLEFEANFKGQFKDGQVTILEGPYQGESFNVGVPGLHNARNLMATLSLCSAAQLGADQIRKGLETFVPPSGRNETKTSKAGATLFCDYYNSNPNSLKAAMDVLHQTEVSGKKWVCLGDMLELGEEEEDLHREVADHIEDYSIDNVLLYGERMKWLHDELSESPPPGILLHSLDHEPLGITLQDKLQEGDVVLIKGSRGMKMETVLKWVD